MGSWIGEYSIERDPYAKGDLYITHEDLGYITDRGIEITVYAGYETDGASVPKIFRWFASPFAGAWAPASLIHDILYHAKVYTRKYSDEIFLEAMRTSGVGWFKRNAMWSALRVGGWAAWNNTSEEKRKKAKQFLEIVHGSH